MAEYPEIIEGMPEVEYLRREEHGSSDLRAALKSLNHFRLKQEEDDEPTESQDLGTAIHCALMEPEKFEADYVAPLPPFDVTELYKKRRDAAALLAAGKTDEEISEAVGVKVKTVKKYLADRHVQALATHYEVYPPDEVPGLPKNEVDVARRVRDSALAHPAARDIIESSRAEVSMFGELDGVAVKGRVDAWQPLRYGDIKTTYKSVDPEGAGKIVAWRDLHVQAGLYCEIGKLLEGRLPEWFWIFAETDPPYNVGVYECSMATMEEGRALVGWALDEIRLLEADPERFGGYSEESSLLSIPGWAYRAMKPGRQ